MPYAISKLGLVHGFVWMLICTLIVMFSLHCLSITACSLSGRQTSYFSAATKYAPRLRLSVDLSIIIQGWGVCLSYLILVGNSIPSLYLFVYSLFYEAYDDMLFFGFEPRQFSIVATMLFVLFPLCCLKTLRALKFMSILAIMCVVYILLMILAYFALFLLYSDESIFQLFRLNVVDRLPISLWKWSFEGILRSIPIFIFGFTCHHNLFNIFNELKQPRSIGKLNKISVVSIASVGMIYFLIAAAGYVTLGDGVDSKLFDSYEYGDVENHLISEFSIILDQFDPLRVSLFMGRLCLLLIVISAFPIQFYPIKISIHNLWTYFMHDADAPSESRLLAPLSDLDMSSPVLSPLIGDQHPKRGMRSDRFHYCVTSIYCLICLILALFVTEFGAVLSLVGATGDNYIALFFGPYIYLLISKGNPPTSRSYWKEACSYFLICFSILLGMMVLAIL
ncbi:vacuolar amino acid transporter 6 [Mitosporidium daphniae]|uniref:Vacuolar amino acid transporter 6 n=1 Tax=Mitosporidium daphniae TaxID=1485682 RepID=A0A098VVD2_9MICR|nr:vacuolar amino acid transporter 6 [Mitosporidium daphniae]KGG52814.1 vacuolar amino acid transporter 6 [Mitosporidium daphniae]|eukprot:XP_013239250.1 vacuolar amino acid transporter 6 [Mitosporidium daphniae]